MALVDPMAPPLVQNISNDSHVLQAISDSAREEADESISNEVANLSQRFMRQIGLDEDCGLPIPENDRPMVRKNLSSEKYYRSLKKKEQKKMSFDE